MGDAALVTQLEAAAAAAAEAPRPQAQLLEELRDFLMHNGVYQSLLQLFADLYASGLTKVRLTDFHRHLTQKLGFGLRDDEWAGLAQVLDADEYDGIVFIEGVSPPAYLPLPPADGPDR